jgi:hypothetical protein
MAIVKLLAQYGRYMAPFFSPFAPAKIAKSLGTSELRKVSKTTRRFAFGS